MNTSPNYDYIGWMIGLAAVILAIVFYYRSKARGKIVYQWSGRNLVGDGEGDLPAEVTILYKGINVPRLSSTQIVIWNAGETTVRGSDIVEGDPLRIALAEDASILQVGAISVTRPVNSFSVHVDSAKPHEALCAFDFLDRADGARILILHTGGKKRPEVRGTIRGIPDGVHSWGKTKGGLLDAFPGRIFPGKKVFWEAYFLVVLGGAAVLLSALAPTIPSRLSSISLLHEIKVASRAARLAGVGAGFIYMLPGLMGFWVIRRRFPKALSSDD